MEEGGFIDMAMTMEADDAELVGFLLDDMRKRWVEIAPLLEKACSFSHGQFTPQSVVEGVAEGALGLFGIDRSGVLTSILVWCITEYASGQRYFDLVLLGGENRHDWLSIVDTELAAFARLKGCSKMRVQGRKAWARELKHWRLSSIVLEREVA